MAEMNLPVTEQTRRQFVAATVAAGASLGVARPAPKYKYIDIHTHLGTFYYGKELTADELVRMMDQHGVERACVLPLVSPESSPYPQTTDAAIAAHRRFPNRLIPFCCVDPRCSTMPPLRPGHELGLPILFHLDDIRNPDTPGLPRLENVLKTFPKLPLIGHAAGFWASISGDATLADFGRYPEVPKPIAAGGAIDRLMAKYPNLYGDLSEPGGEKAIARDRAFGRDFIIRRADQLLFGTDWLMPGQQVPQFDLLDSLNLPNDVQSKVYRDNALRLLKLQERA